MENKIHFFLLQALGDNVTTLSIVNSLISDKTKIQLHGTKLTKQILELLNIDYPLSLPFLSLPSFYNIRKDGIWNALISFVILVVYIYKNIPNNNLIFFEKIDFRLYAIKLFCPTHHILAPRCENNFYIDKITVISKLLNQPFSFSFPVIQSKQKSFLLINPTGSREIKNLSHTSIDIILDAALELGISVTLIDYQQLYTPFATKVTAYYTHTTLSQALEILKKSDLYCGPDSLFIHLSYQFNIPFFCIMNYDSSYFLPPASTNNYCVVQSGKELFLKQKFISWIQSV